MEWNVLNSLLSFFFDHSHSDIYPFPEPLRLIVDSADVLQDELKWASVTVALLPSVPEILFDGFWSPCIPGKESRAGFS